MQAETSPVPSDDRVRLDNRDGAQHRREQAIETDEEQAIGDRQFRLRGNTPAQHVQLMRQHDDFGFQPRLRLERRDQHVEKQTDEREHLGSAYPTSLPSAVWIEFSVSTPPSNGIRPAMSCVSASSLVKAAWTT